MILLSALGCGGENSERGQARALLERIAAIDSSAPLRAREQALSALAALPLSAPALVRTRDRCVRAHGGLLGAEREQALAAQRLDQAKQSPLSPAELTAVKAQVTHAAELLRQAQAVLPECERGTRELALRVR